MYNFTGSLFLVDYYKVCFFLLASFSHQRYLMVFNMSLRERKSPQMFRILLSIQANLSNAEGSMVSARPPISFRDSSKCTNYYVTFLFQDFFFLVLWKDPSICLNFHFHWFSLCGQPGRQSPLFVKFSFFFIVDYLLVWSSSRDFAICFYVKILENFVRLIVQDQIHVCEIWSNLAVW